MENKSLVAQWQQCIFLLFFKLVFKTYQKKKSITLEPVSKLALYQNWTENVLDYTFLCLRHFWSNSWKSWTLQRQLDWRSWKKNRARQKNHLRFNLQCRDEDKTRASLDMKSSIPTRNVKNIIKTARKALIREPIRTTASKIHKIKNKMNSFKAHYKLEQKTEEEVNAHLKHEFEEGFGNLSEQNKVILNQNLWNGTQPERERRAGRARAGRLPVRLLERGALIKVHTHTDGGWSSKRGVNMHGSSVGNIPLYMLTSLFIPHGTQLAPPTLSDQINNSSFFFFSFCTILALQFDVWCCSPSNWQRCSWWLRFIFSTWTTTWTRSALKWSSGCGWWSHNLINPTD